MNKFMLWMTVINIVSCMLNLAAYAWGSHDAASLAIGVGNGFVALLCKPSYA